MKRPLAAYSTEARAAVGAWVLLEVKEEQTGGAVGRGGQNSQLRTEAGGEKNISQQQGESIDAQRAKRKTMSIEWLFCVHSSSSTAVLQLLQL